jgi:predicted flavoprotein YhiN
MQGLALKNVAVTVCDTAKKNKTIYEDFGEMLFTHFGVSGPTILSASAHMRPMEKDRYDLYSGNSTYQKLETKEVALPTILSSYVDVPSYV